jgi:ATP-binding cassette, subfamily B, bacterial
VSEKFNPTHDIWENLAPEMLSVVEERLTEGELPLVWLEPDLDSELNYARSLVVLTDRRLLSVGPIEESEKDKKKAAKTFQEWPVDTAFTLRIREHSGTGLLELIGAEKRLYHWRFTAGKVNAAHRMSMRFERLQEGDASEEEDTSDSLGAVCPSCGALLAPEQLTCPECEAAKGKPPMQSLSRLFSFAKPRAFVVTLGFILTVSSTATQQISPFLIMPLIDDVLNPYERGENINFNLVWLYLLGFAGASLLAWLLTWARTYVVAWAAERVSADLRNKTYAHLQSLSIDFFGGKRTGDLIARISTDTDRICYFLSVYLLDFLNDVLTLIIIAIIFFCINPLLGIVTLLPLPLIAFLVHRVRNRLRRGFQLGSRAWSEMTSVLADTIPGIRVVKAFAQEHREIDRFQQANDRVFQANNRVNILWSFFGPIVVFLTDVGLLVVWAFGAYQIYHSNIKVGVLVGFVVYISRFYSRMDSMSRMVSAVQRTASSTQRIFSILDRVPSVAEPVHPVHPGRLRGEVEFRAVGFHYGSRPILQELNLKIQPGEMVGLVGHSGAGKTTIVNLVCRFYDVSEGAILVDGVDIRSYPLEEYRQHVGIVLQEPFLFFGTIAENIAYGRPDASRDEIIDAARAARAHEFILRLPDGYDSLVGERGQFLSGGERQRISIARALLIDPRILILDEATSSVDTETEREIQLALENLIQGRTTIAIAHRLSTLRRADRLVVLERGRITEVGHHNDLVNKSGIYARLYKAQLDMTHGNATAATK